MFVYMYAAYTQLMKEMWNSATPLSISTSTRGHTYNNIFPTNFKRAMAAEYPLYSGSDQQDAQEFMRFLVSSLHDEMKMSVSQKYCPFQFTSNESGRYVCVHVIMGLRQSEPQLLEIAVKFLRCTQCTCTCMCMHVLVKPFAEHLICAFKTNLYAHTLVSPATGNRQIRLGIHTDC